MPARFFHRIGIFAFQNLERRIEFGKIKSLSSLYSCQVRAVTALYNTAASNSKRKSDCENKAGLCCFISALDGLGLTQAFNCSFFVHYDSKQDIYLHLVRYLILASCIFIFIVENNNSLTCPITSIRARNMSGDVQSNPGCAK